ncbi:MAG: hydroxymethylbilane synthase [Pelagibacteraceae bacterium]
MKKIVIGARGSKLSLAYVAKVKNNILKKNQHLIAENIEFKSIKTSGDIHQDKKLSEIGGKNLFCKEVEENLLSKRIDLAVHSLKDMDSNEDKDLIIGAYMERNDPCEVLISKKLNDIKNLNKKVIIGSSSRRRELQLQLINKNFSIINIRGNIDTRIRKLDDGEIDGVILAAAGVKSLNFENKISFSFNIDEMLPAVGQGIIAVQCRKNDEEIIKILKNINNQNSFICANAEREMLKFIGGDCHTAVGGYAYIENNKLRLKAQLFSDDGKKSFRAEEVGDKSNFIEIGKTVGTKLLELAGKNFFKK